MNNNHDSLTPPQIVRELDKHIVGQQEAKRAVAVALRNRWRRQQLSAELREEITPKNIIMIGPTGVGKTEIARRLSRLVHAPFIKVEASKFTEVGYVGRDVESMVRDLTHLAVNMMREIQREKIWAKATALAEEKLLDLLLPRSKRKQKEPALSNTREKLRLKLQAGELDERLVEIEIQDRSMPVIEVLAGGNMEEMEMNLRDMLPPAFFPNKLKKRKTKVGEARKSLAHEEAQKLIDMDEVVAEAIQKVEQTGIIFIDELDKISGRESPGAGPDISREGVQRDLLPIVEGSSVSTRYGLVKTDHILFIAAGAFHSSKPSDLIPELQGRFPIRVELNPLNEDDLVRILTEPQNALIKQYIALMSAENIELVFKPGAIKEIANLAAQVNQRTEDIGARRLHTLLERLLEEISFKATDNSHKRITINAAYVRKRLADIVKSEDLSRYIL